MKIEEKSVQELKGYKQNNKTHPAKQVEMIANSIKQFGFKNPIIIDKNNEIIAGHGRLLGAKQLGMETVPCIIADDLTEEQVRAYRLLDNKIGGFGEYDMENIIAELGDIGDYQLGLESLDSIFKDLVPEDNKEIEEDNYEIPEEIKTDIVLGDLFQIGEHKLLCGDSTKQGDVAKLVNGELMDLVVTDPPYNVDYVGKTKDSLKIDNDSMDDNTFYQFLLAFYTSMGEYTKDGGAWYVWHADSEGVNFRKAMKDGGLLIKQCLIRVKNSMVMRRQDYQWKHEPCLYGWKPGAGHYFVDDRTNTTVIEDQVDYKKLKKEELLAIVEELMSEDTKTSVIHCDRPSRSDIHPTMKPIKLLAPLIQCSSREGEIVGDAFLGSGSTMVACHQTNRKCYGIEIDPKYCQVIIDRMIKLDPTLEIKKNGLSYNPISNG